MSDTEKRDAVLSRFSRQYDHFPDLVGPDLDAMADRIVELEAAVERVRMAHKCGCPILRALEGTP